MTSTRERYRWLDRAACLPYPDWDSSGAHAEMLAVCATCPVRRPCLREALRLGIDGVRGGMLPAQRASIIRATGRPRGPSIDEYVGMVDGRREPPGGAFNLYARVMGHGTEVHSPNPF